jgi:hypothetical protein
MWHFVLLHFVTYYLNLHGLHPEVHFINVLRATFMSADPKRANKIDNFTAFFALSGKKLLVERWWIEVQKRERDSEVVNLFTLLGTTSA